MDEMNWTLPPELEHALSDFYSAPEPAPLFAAHLEEQLARLQIDLLQAGTVAEPSWWSSIIRRLKRKEKTNMNPKLKLVWTVVLVLLGLILATTAAYAVYRYFSDPGLQAVNEAGMFTDVNSTAQPTVLPTQPPDASSGAATLIGLEQTQGSVTVRLEWVSLLDPRQIFQVSARGLGTQMELGMPKVTYPGVTPEQYQGAIFSLDGDKTISGRYVSYQILRKDGQFGGQLEMQIDIPLLQSNGDQATQVANFHFDLKDVPVIVPNGWGGGNAYSVRVNGLEMRLVHTVVTPHYTQARLCYDVPTTGQDWVIEQAAIQFANQTQLHDLPVSMQSLTQAEAEGSQRCADVRFPQGKNPGDVFFRITATGLAQAGGQDKIDSAWQLSMGLVDDVQVAGAPGPGPEFTPTPETPLAAQSKNKLTVMLLSVYADANRMAVTLRVDGADPAYGFNASLKDADGYEINSSIGMGPTGDNPNLYTLVFVPEDMSQSKVPGFSPIVPLAGERFKGKLAVGIPSKSGDGSETAFDFDLDVPIYPALVLEPMQAVTVNGIEMRLEKLKITPSYTRIYLCYTKPTLKDWGIGAASLLQIGSSQASQDGYGLVFDPDFDLGKNHDPDFTPSLKTGRCVKLGYPVGYHDRPETLTLTIPELEQSFPEVIPDAEVKQAQAKLKAQGIEMDYVTFTGNGGGGGGPEIKKKPDGMSDQQVIRLFYRALGYYHTGPWTFTVEIKP